MSKETNNITEEKNDFDDCILPFISFIATIYAVLFPLFWIPFTFTKIGFPVFLLYVWPFCILAWIISLIVAQRYMQKRGFERFIVISALICIIVQTVLIFYFSYPDLWAGKQPWTNLELGSVADRPWGILSLLFYTYICYSLLIINH